MLLLQLWGVLALSLASFEEGDEISSGLVCGLGSVRGSEMGNRKKTGTNNFKKRRALRQDIGYVEKKSNLCVMSLNVNGLTQSSIHDIEAAASSKRVDIVAVTETKFRLEENPDHHKIPGFNFFGQETFCPATFCPRTYIVPGHILSRDNMSRLKSVLKALVGVHRRDILSRYQLLGATFCPGTNF